MINLDDYTDENKKLHNENQPSITDNRYRILIIGGSRSGKTNELLNLINNKPDIDKIYLHAKDPYKAKNQLLIYTRQKVGLEHFNDPKAFIQYSNDAYDVYKNINKYNTDKDRKMLIVFDNMITDMINNNKLNSIVTNLLLEVEN